MAIIFMHNLFLICVIFSGFFSFSSFSIPISLEISVFCNIISSSFSFLFLFGLTVLYVAKSFFFDNDLLISWLKKCVRGFSFYTANIIIYPLGGNKGEVLFVINPCLIKKANAFTSLVTLNHQKTQRHFLAFLKIIMKDNIKNVWLNWSLTN